MTRQPVKQRAYRGLSKIYGSLFKPRVASGLRVLMYHAIGGALASDPHGNSISPALFEKHMAHVDSLRSSWTITSFCATQNEGLRIAITFDDGYADTLTAAAPVLVEKKLPFTVFIASGFIQSGLKPYLTLAQLKELARLPNVTIGSHGATHRALVGLSDGLLQEELATSRKYLEDLIGIPVIALSYPHGSVDLRVREAAAKAGYLLGGTSRYGFNAPDRDPLLLCRTEVTAFDEVEDLALKIGGAWDWYRYRHADPAKGQP